MKSIRLTIFVAISILAASCNNQKLITPNNSIFIPVDTANLMIGSYLESIADSILGIDTTQLNSLIIDADALRTYLDNQEIKKVKIMFAHTLDYIHGGNKGHLAGYQVGALTVVLAGYDKNENYIFAPGRMVPNHLTPCPDFCPKNGTAANNLLE